MRYVLRGILAQKVQRPVDPAVNVGVGESIGFQATVEPVVAVVEPG